METEKIIITILVAMIVIPLIFLSFFSFMQPGKGQHTGFITSVETYGVIWETTRAYIKTDTQSSQEDKYCVQDESVINNLKTAQELNKKVTIEYSSPFIMPDWKCGGESSVIINIKK